jgi:RecB family exonuclease
VTIAEASTPPLPAADAPLPAYESYSSLTTYEACPRRYAFRYVERLPGEVRPGQFAFGNAIHKAFEIFVRQCIRVRPEGEPAPGLDLLQRACDEVLERAGLEPEELAGARVRAVPVLARFLEREASSFSTPVAAELGFGVDVAIAAEVPAEAPGEAAAETPAATSSVRFVGYVDRVDRAPDGSTEVLDYKTGRARGQVDVDADRQLTAYAYACARGALRDPATGETLPPASRLCLYFADSGAEVSTGRTPEQLAAFERDLVAMAGRVRRREFDARPDAWRCRWCEYRNLCPDARRDG